MLKITKLILIYIYLELYKNPSWIRLKKNKDNRDYRDKENDY